MFGGKKAPPRPTGPPPLPSQPVTVPAFRYVYSLEKQDWVEVLTTVCVPNPARGFEAGGMRICFEVQEIDEHGQRTEMVAKFFKKNIDRVVEIDYFNEGAAQCMSDQFAQSFNKRLSSLPPAVYQSIGGQACRISFLMCQVVRIRTKDLPLLLQANPAAYGRDSFFTFRTTDKKEVMFVMEYKLKGTFTKYNSNFGDTYEQSDSKKPLSQEEEVRRARVFKFSEAFSHFSLEESGGSMLVCDLQGVHDFFTDPQIHTEDGKGLGMGNMGQEGIDKWLSRHTCNDLCKALKLKPLQCGIPISVQLQSPSTSQYAAFRQQSNLFQERPPVDPDASPPPPAPPHDLLAYLQGGEMLSTAHSGGGGEPGSSPSISPPPPAAAGDTAAAFASPPKPVSEMTEEEQIEYAIQKSLIDTQRTR